MKEKIAIVYDWIDSWGGVERMLLELHRIFPEAVFFTSYYDSDKATWAKDLKIKTSFMQHLPGFIRKNRLLSFIFYPYAFESFDFTGYNSVISVSSSFAKGIVTKPETKHVNIMLTPTRYLWLYPEQYLSGWKKLLNQFIKTMKHWDKLAAQRPDKIIAISKTVADRCEKIYGRKAEVVYPPFDSLYWRRENEKIKNKNEKLHIKKIKIPGKYYLIVSRLEPYNKIELAIDAFNQMPDRILVVTGEGREKNMLEKKAGKNIFFTGSISDTKLALLNKGAEALIMPQEEDFGYVSLEAQFFGCPVIAYAKGGATETVADGQTGIFFTKQSIGEIVKAVERFEAKVYNWKLPKDWESDDRFSRSIFRHSLLKIITD